MNVWSTGWKLALKSCLIPTCHLSCCGMLQHALCKTRHKISLLQRQLSPRRMDEGILGYNDWSSKYTPLYHSVTDMWKGWKEIIMTPPHLLFKWFWVFHFFSCNVIPPNESPPLQNSWMISEIFHFHIHFINLSPKGCHSGRLTGFWLEQHTPAGGFSVQHLYSRPFKIWI